MLNDNAEKARKGGWILPNNLSSFDKFKGCNDLKGIYDLLTQNTYSGRCTAPLLIDYTNLEIVSNESNDILKILNENNSIVNLRPNSIVEEMDVLASFLFDKLSNGCYRTGFCTSQFAYEEAAEDVKEGLRVLEERLEGKRFIMGEEVRFLRGRE